MAIGSKEPADHFDHGYVSFYRDTLEFYVAAVKFYESILNHSLNDLESDEDLRIILGEGALSTFPVSKEVERTRRAREWLEENLSRDNGRQPDFDLYLSHGVVRYLKTVAMIYLEHLRRRRDRLANKDGIHASIVQAVDQQMSRLEEKANIGVFREATPYPLIMPELPDAPDENVRQEREIPLASRDRRPPPVLLNSIEIQDPELRKRCLDLFEQFRQEGAHDRLDTVITEATRILEDRLRRLTAAPAGCTGAKLAEYAFTASGNRLTVSDVPAEQDAAHLLYRGAFGFIRNSVHHRLVENLQPERVLQIVGTIDYLIFVAEGARRSSPAGETSAE